MPKIHNLKKTVYGLRRQVLKNSDSKTKGINHNLVQEGYCNKYHTIFIFHCSRSCEVQDQGVS